MLINSGLSLSQTKKSSTTRLWWTSSLVSRKFSALLVGQNMATSKIMLTF